MIFSRLSALVPLAALTVFAAAAPNVLEARTAPPPTPCNEGDTYCCDTQSMPPGKYDSSPLAGLLGILLTIGNLEVKCAPIVGIVASGSQCTTQTVCCTNDYSVSLVNLSCTPISVNV